MLSIKSEDGKALEVDRTKFKDMQEVIDHATKTFGSSEDACLATMPIHGTVGVIMSSFKSLGMTFEILIVYRYAVANCVEICAC